MLFDGQRPPCTCTGKAAALSFEHRESRCADVRLCSSQSGLSGCLTHTFAFACARARAPWHGMSSCCRGLCLTGGRYASLQLSLSLSEDWLSREAGMLSTATQLCTSGSDLMRVR